MSEPIPKWRWVVVWIALAAVYLVTGRMCIAVSALVGNVSWVLFIPAGLSLTASLLWGRWIWPGVFLGELAIGLTTGLPVASSVIMAAGNGIDAALAGWLFHDRLGRRLEFDRLEDVVQLLVAELVLLQPLSTVMGMAALNLAGAVTSQQIWPAASAWYAANVFAQFVIAPPALAWVRWRRPASSPNEYAELALLGLLTVLVGSFGPGRWAIAGLPLPVALLFSFPLVVWASVRFVPSVPVTLGTILGLFAFDAMLAGSGPLREAPLGDQMFYLNVFMGVCLGTALFLAAAMGQQRRFESDQARLIEQLQASLNHVRTLKDFVTFCAWTGKVRWKERWVSVEEFLADRYGLTISHGISEEAMAQVLREYRAASAAKLDPPRTPAEPSG